MTTVLEYLKNIGDSITGVKVKPIAGRDKNNNIIMPLYGLDGFNYSSVKAWYSDLLLGNVPGYYPWARRLSIKAGNEQHALLSELAYSVQSSGAQRSLKSSSAADSYPSGTGIQKVRVYYIRSTDGTENTEDIELSGTTAVNTSNTDILHINNIRPMIVGSGEYAAGIISVYTAANGGGSAFCAINAGDVEFECAQYFVPSNRHLFVSEVWAILEVATILFLNYTNDLCYREEFEKTFPAGEVTPLHYLIHIPASGVMRWYYTTGTSNKLISIVMSGFLKDV